MRNRIRELRKEAGLRQEDMAKALGVSRQTIIAVENNKYNPTLELALKMAKLLKKKGIALSAQFGIPMVDNYVPMFKVADGEEIERKLDEAEEYIDEARRAIRARGIGDYNRCRGMVPGMQTAALYPLYARGRSTKPFVVTEQCIGCGLCQEICPCGAISLVGGKPEWRKSKCVRCLGCLHRCPVEAIHWKTADENRGRYYNPRVEP